MQLVLQKIEPSSFQNPHISANDRHLFTFSRINNFVTIGRPQMGSKSTNTMHLDVRHQSISRKHAKIIMSPFYLDDDNHKQQDVPSWYLKLKGIWQQLPFYTLQNIRQYCQPRQVLLVVDLDSKYGLFKEVSAVSINNQHIKTNIKSTQSRHQIQLKPNTKIDLQIGNENVTVDQICWNLNKTQVISYQENINKTRNNLKVVLKPINALQQFPSQFSTLLLTHQQQVENGKKSKSFLLICAQSPQLFNTLTENERKFSLGRHPGCDIQINKGSISRKQAYIFMANESQWIVQDAQSMNGLWVKCKKLQFSISELANKIQTSDQLLNTQVLRQLQSEDHQQNNQSDEQKKEDFQVQKVASIKLGEVKFNVRLNKIQNQNHQNHQIIQKNEYQSILTEIF